MLKPQLAVACKDTSKLKYPLIVEPKLDGVRCLVHLGVDKISCYSRDLKPLVNFAELEEELVKDFLLFKGAILDGEVIANSRNFDDTISRARSHRGVNTHIDYTFCIFDVVVPNKPLIERKRMLEGYTKGKHWRVMPWLISVDEQELMTEHAINCRVGFEGTMIKNMYGLYHHGRNQDWKKLKPFHTADLTITSITEGKGKASGMMGRIEVQGFIGDAGNVFVKSEVGTGFSDEVRKDMFNNKDKYLGKVAEIQYQEITKDNSLRFPSFKRMRTDLND
jgi:DNA ligase-1